MASNFKISKYRNSNTLHLKLIGDFDGTSACELLDMLKRDCNGVYRVIIHTSRLRKIHPFGVDTFYGNMCDLKDCPICILFTGRHAHRIAPVENKCFSDAMIVS